MTSSPSDAPADPGQAVRLPIHCTTVSAEDIRVRLVLAADLNRSIEVDASAVESVGQAVLQLLVAARKEMVGAGLPFTILDPSPAFVERTTRCCLADALGLEIEKEDAL